MRAATLWCGVPVDDVTMDEAVDDIAALVRDGRTTGAVHQVATVNLDFVTNALRDRDVMRILQRSSLCVPDGMPILWGAAALGAPLRERVAGADLVPHLAARAAAEGWTVVLFGGTPGVAEEAAATLGRAHPGACVLGREAPSMPASAETDAAVLAEVAAMRADVVCVALGNPKQERWIARHGTAIGAPVMIGVGGTLDFLVGRTRRAPDWARRAGLEWAHRALNEPARLLPRYARDARVCGPRLVRQVAGERRAPTVAPRPAEITRVAGGWQMRATGGLDPRRDAGLQQMEVVAGDHVALDAAAAGAGLATRATVVSLARRSQRPVQIERADPALLARLDAADLLHLVKTFD